MKKKVWFPVFLLLSGCVVAPAPYYATMPPPPPREEFIGVAPAAGYVWIGGYWNWVGGRYAWSSGHWEPPRPGYRYVPHRWVREGDRWHRRGGRWERER